MSEFNLQRALAAVAARRAENPITEAVRPQIDPNSPQERIARAKQLEHDIWEKLEWLQSQPDSALKVERTQQFFDRLGELAAEQGDYERARDLSYSPERRAHYESLVAAITIENDAACACPEDLEVDHQNRQEFRSPAIVTVDQIVSPTGGLLNLDVCRKCGFANAR